MLQQCSMRLGLQEALDSLKALGLQLQQRGVALWSSDHNCPGDVMDSKGFVNAAMACYLCYFPILVVAVHAIFLVLIVVQSLRSLTRGGKESEQTELARMHRATKLVCIGLLLLDTSRGWPSQSTSEFVLCISQAVAWLIISIALQREEASRREIYGSILKAWWIAMLGLSTVACSAAVRSGQIVNAGLEFVPLVSSLCLAVLSFSGGCVYGARVGQIDGLDDSANAPLLSEFLPEEAAQVTPGGSGFSKAGLVSVLAFLWLNPLLAVGNRRPLRIPDVPLLDPVDAPEANHEAFQDEWKRQRTQTGPGAVPSMGWTLFQTFWRSFAASFVLILLLVLSQFVGPLLQNRLIKLMEAEHHTFAGGFTLVLVLLTGKLCESIFGHQLVFRSRKLGLRMWAGVGCAVYRKSLRLSLKARQVRGVGEITNIISADLQRLLDLAYYIQQGLVIPLQVIVAVVILFEVVGVAMIAGLSSLVLVLILNALIVRRMRSFRARLLVSKDKRMRATSECLGSLKVIKLQTWDEMFKERIEGIREEELSWIQKFMYTWGNAIHMVWNGPLVLSGVTFVTMVLLGEALTADRVFTALTTFKIIQEPIRFVPDITANIIQSMVSVNRIGAFLLEDEVDEDAVERISEECDHAVEIEGATFAWDKTAHQLAVRDLTLKIKRGSCVAICGAVGAGKSSLLSCIMGELPRLTGTAKLSGRLAYVAQSAWIQNNTIKENILFGRTMDPSSYKEAVRVSGLESDLAQFPDGDETEIGERGTTLSGGQKQRVQLARAVYQNADVYVLDDPFSAVDAHTGTFLFEECVKGALKHKTILLVTHQVEFLPAVDQIIVMRAPGEIVQKGTYNELVHEGKEFGAFVEALQESLHNVSRASQNSLEGEPEMGTLLDSVCETLGRGKQTALASQLSGGRAGSLSKSSFGRTSGVTGKQTTKGKLIQEEIREVGRVDKKIIFSYLSKVAKGALWCLVVVPQSTTTTFLLCSDLWLASGTSTRQPTSLRFMLIYVLFLTGCSISVFVRTRLVAWTGVATAQAFFAGMLNSIFRAPMSFIDATPVGRILSRSSTDQTAVDVELPFLVAGVSNSVIGLIGTLLLITYVTPKILLLTFPLGYLFVRLQTILLRWELLAIEMLPQIRPTLRAVPISDDEVQHYVPIYYITSSRELSRLTALTEAPMFLHVSESIGGATTIRAFQEQDRFAATNVLRLGAYQRSYFHNMTAAEWLGFRLDSLSATVLSGVAILLITLPQDKIDPGLVGMSLSYGLSMSSVLMRLVQSSSMVENRMVSVERILQYSNIPSEAPTFIPGRIPASGWPTAGRIELQQLQIRYRPDLPMVLKGVSFVIHPREKVGVVGRTGSGKSTLVQALFRLIEPAGGRILIDGLDISTIGLNDLRSALGVIPQEPTLFEGSVRSNLDPFNTCSDQQIWESLDKCQLGHMVRDKPEKLNATVSEQGENWSVGERQLLCLARALLKHSLILVLDEATASVDITTDAVIQSTIRQYFADCTVISVAHRIPSVIDSDRVLVLDQGHLKENNSPEHLLANQKSMFSNLVKEYTSRTDSSNSLYSLI